MMERKQELESVDEKDLSKEDMEELTKLRAQLKNKILEDDSVEVEVDDKLDSTEVPEEAKDDIDELKSITSGKDED
jgi:hypothetical protein